MLIPRISVRCEGREGKGREGKGREGKDMSDQSSLQRIPQIILLL